MRDFTLIKYKELLAALLQQGYEFRTFEELCRGNSEGKFVVLRHDVDARPEHSLRCAELEHQAGIRGSYYFRIVPQSNRPGIIRAIASLGHEIGYHYEEMSLARGDIDKAIELFGKNLAYFRQYYPVSTICMHGSPLSGFDNRELWNRYDYRRWNIIGEPYFDIDFSDVFYLTDTGRCWNGETFSIRDKVQGNGGPVYRTTDDILRAIEEDTLPRRIMMTVHPQRWNDNFRQWIAELVLQNIKNQVKRIIVRQKLPR